MATVAKARRLRQRFIYEDEITADEIKGMERLERGGVVTAHIGSWTGLRYWEVPPA